MGTGDAAQEAREMAMPLVPNRRLLPVAVRTVVIVALTLACVATPGFFSLPNILSLLTTVSFMGCVAVGMTLITISGNIMSFSLGATVGAAAMVFIVALWFSIRLAAPPIEPELHISQHPEVARIDEE